VPPSEPARACLSLTLGVPRAGRRHTAWPDCVIHSQTSGSGGAAAPGRSGAVAHRPALSGAVPHRPRKVLGLWPAAPERFGARPAASRHASTGNRNVIAGAPLPPGRGDRHAVPVRPSRRGSGGCSGGTGARLPWPMAARGGWGAWPGRRAVRPRWRLRGSGRAGWAGGCGVCRAPCPPGLSHPAADRCAAASGGMAAPPGPGARGGLPGARGGLAEHPGLVGRPAARAGSRGRGSWSRRCGACAGSPAAPAHARPVRPAARCPPPGRWRSAPAAGGTRGGAPVDEDHFRGVGPVPVARLSRRAGGPGQNGTGTVSRPSP
jgi:hypothetical protein